MRNRCRNSAIAAIDAFRASISAKRWHSFSSCATGSFRATTPIILQKGIHQYSTSIVAVLLYSLFAIRETRNYKSYSKMVSNLCQLVSFDSFKVWKFKIESPLKLLNNSNKLMRDASQISKRISLSSLPCNYVTMMMIFAQAYFLIAPSAGFWIQRSNPLNLIACIQKPLIGATGKYKAMHFPVAL